MYRKIIKLFLLLLLLLILVIGIFFSVKKLKKKENPTPFQETTTVNNDNESANLILTKNKKVIIISIDNVRPDHLGLYGYDRDTSPNIDKFGRESVIFKNAYAPSPSTVPAHISLFTGLHPRDFKIFTNVPNKELHSDTNLPTLFRNNGYETAAFIGSWLLSFDFFKPGFNTFDFEAENNKQQIITSSSLEDFPWISERSNEKTNEKVSDWLEKNYTKDFFLFVHYYDASPPYENNCGQDFSSNFKKPSDRFFSKGIVIPLLESSSQDTEFLKAKYDEGIFCDDKSVGELIEKLKKLGIYDYATIILMSDHGEYFDHSLLFHGYTLHEESIRVALIIKSPFLKIDEEKSKIPVALTDVFPALSRIFKLTDDESIIDSPGIDNPQLRDLFFIVPNLKASGFLGMIDLFPDVFPKELHDSYKETMAFFYEGLISNNKKIIMAGNNIDSLYNLSNDRNDLKDLKSDSFYKNFVSEGVNKIQDFFKEIKLSDLPFNADNQPVK